VSIDLNAPEVKEAIKAAVEEATAPLIAKRDELLREVKQARKGQQIDPETVTKLEEQIETLKGELTTAQKAAKTATTEAEKATKARETAEASFVSMVRENSLTDALTKHGVTNPVHLKAAKSMLASQVEVVNDNGTFVAKVGDKALADYAKEWALGDEGKHFVAAPANGGGGAPGASGTNPAGSTGKPQKLVGDKTAQLARARQLLSESGAI
jgi:alanyl-tRNA synthetase